MRNELGRLLQRRRRIIICKSYFSFSHLATLFASKSISVINLLNKKWYLGMSILKGRDEVAEKGFGCRLTSSSKLSFLWSLEGPEKFLWSRRPRLQRHFRLKPTNESDHGRFRVFLAFFIEILPAKGDQTPNLGVQFSPLMVIIACHAREQPQLSCRYHRRRSQCELSQKLSWTRQLGKNPKRK